MNNFLLAIIAAALWANALPGLMPLLTRYHYSDRPGANIEHGLLEVSESLDKIATEIAKQEYSR